MKNKDLFNLFNSLCNLSNLKGIKFSYGIIKNKKNIKNEIEILQNIIKPSQEFIEFDKEREKLCKKYSKKDEKGEIIIKNNNYDIKSECKEIFNKEFDDLKEQNKEFIIKREKQLEEYNKLLEEECNIELHKIKIRGS